MAAPKTYQVKSATWTASGSTAKALSGVQQASVDESGTPTEWSGDGVAGVQAVNVEDIAVDVTLEFTDQFTELEDSDFAVGIAGQLVLVCQQRKTPGKGAVAGADKTITIANAVITSKSIPAPHRGQANGSLTFRCVDPDGGDVIAYS